MICLALVGLCVCCIVPVLVLTQDEAGRVLGYIVAIAALFMVSFASAAPSHVPPALMPC